jgi:hypothetical protein
VTPQDIIEFKLNPALEECAVHRQRLHQAWLEAGEFAALKEDAALVLSLEDAQVRTLDQLVYRFGRLQDAMGTRLLPALLQMTQEWRDDEPFLDKLNRAEKLGMLTSAEQWQLLRELRNQTAHEYPAQPELMRANLRRLVAQVPTLEQAHDQMAVVARQRMSASPSSPSGRGAPSTPSPSGRGRG